MNKLISSKQKNKKLVAANKDLTKRLRSAEREIENLNKTLSNLELQKEEFISMAAHELRAPTTAIKGYVSMVMEGDAGEISDKARGFLADAKSTNDRLIRLVGNMINVSRIEKGKIIYQIERVSLGDMVSQVYEDFKFEASRKNLKFTLEVAKDVNDQIYVDPNRIREVVANLVSNAVKYTEFGYVALSLSNPKGSKKRIRLAIKDSGPGISRQEQDKLFKKFYRVQTTAGKTIGTGLGLYICRLVVKKFKGKIGVDSDLGKGSVFWVEIPTIID